MQVTRPEYRNGSQLSEPTACWCDGGSQVSGRQPAPVLAPARRPAAIVLIDKGGDMTRTAVTTTWYGPHLGSTVRTVSTEGSVSRIGRLAGPDDVLVVGARQRGVLPLLLRETLAGHRRVVLVEFIRESPTGWRRATDLPYRLLLRRAVHRLHVLTRGEVERYSRRYGLRDGVAVYVPWPLRPRDEDEQPRAPRQPGKVVASGRAACDWPTVFAALDCAQEPWRLTVVCGSQDIALVGSLASPETTIKSEISPLEHATEVASAEVYALVLRESHASAGHIRLMEAVAAGTPVVATTVSGLEGYALDGETALTVPPGDPATLAATVDSLLRDADLRRAQADRAVLAVESRTFERYFEDLAVALLS